MDGHKFACMLNQSESPVGRINVPSQSKFTQPKITGSIKQASNEAYLKMIRTAYSLAMEPTLPSRQFKTLVKVQRDNGVRLIDGKSINYFLTL